MYRSQVSSYNICTGTPYGVSSGRDPLKELADACQATKTNGSPYEIKMGFYYSHDADWYEPDGGAFRSLLHPNLTNSPAALQTIHGNPAQRSTTPGATAWMILRGKPENGYWNA